MQLYNDKKEMVGLVTQFTNRSITKTLNGDKELTFECPSNILMADNIKEEYYIRTKDDEFVIKSVEKKGNRNTYYAVLNVEELEGKWFPYGFAAYEQTIKSSLNTIFEDTGWTVGICKVTKKRTIDENVNLSAWDILQMCKNTYRCEYTIDSINKKVNIYEKMGDEKGCYFIEGLNLRNLTLKSDTYDFCTRLIPMGKDGIKITLLNDGKEYIDNFQYSNKVKTLVWIDERYTNTTSLLEDAIEKLEEMSKPYKSYEADIVDLAKSNLVYKNILDYELGDTIHLISKKLHTKEKQRIVKITEYPESPEKNTIEISNTTKTFEEIQVEESEKVKYDALTIINSNMKKALGKFPTTEEVETRITSSANTITAGVSQKLQNYYNKIETENIIQNSVNGINLEVSKIYMKRDDMGNYPTVLQVNAALQITEGKIEGKVSKEDFDNVARNLIDGTTDKTTGYQMGTWNKGFKTVNLSDIGVNAGDYITFSAYLGSAGSSYVDDINVRIDQKDASDTTISYHNGNYVKNNIGGWCAVTVKIGSECTKLSLVFGRKTGSATAATFVFTSQKEKLEKGKNRTEWMKSQNDLETAIGKAETTATQAYDRFTWIVKSGTAESNITFTDKVYELIVDNIKLKAANIDLTGYTTINNNFKIDTSGKAYMKEGEFSGKVTASSGVIGKWNIDSNGGLYADYGNYRTFMQPAASGIGANTWVYSMQKKASSGDEYNGTFIVYASGKVFSKELEGTLVSTTQICGTNLQLCGAGEFKDAYSVWVRPNISNYVGAFAPKIDAGTSGSMKLGSAAYRWTELNAASSTIVTSDARMKENILALDANMALNFINKIETSTYKLKDGSSGRTHWGMIAQQIEEIMTELNLTSTDFAGLIKSPKTKEVKITDSEGNETIELEEIPNEYTYGLRYEEFIAPIIKVVQEQQKEIELLKEKIKKIEGEV